MGWATAFDRIKDPRLAGTGNSPLQCIVSDEAGDGYGGAASVDGTRELGTRSGEGGDGGAGISVPAGWVGHGLHKGRLAEGTSQRLLCCGHDQVVVASIITIIIGLLGRAAGERLLGMVDRPDPLPKLGIVLVAPPTNDRLGPGGKL